MITDTPLLPVQQKIYEEFISALQNGNEKKVIAKLAEDVAANEIDFNSKLNGYTTLDHACKSPYSRYHKQQGTIDALINCGARFSQKCIFELLAMGDTQSLNILFTIVGQDILSVCNFTPFCYRHIYTKEIKPAEINAGENISKYETHQKRVTATKGSWCNLL